MKRTKSAGGVVLNKKDEILVVSQNGDSWSLPKGHIDPGEDALTAARREVHEETGIRRLIYQGPLGTYRRHRIGDRSELKTITFFLFRTSQKKLKPLDSSHPEARWVKKEKVAMLLTHQKDKSFIRRLLRTGQL